MALTVKQSAAKQDFGRVEDGTYPARIVQIIDFGMQIETDWKTNEPKTYEDGNLMIKPKAWINFELPDETIEIDGVERPRRYGKEYTISAHEKSAMAALIKAVDSKGTATNGGKNISGLLGLPAMLAIGSTSSGKAKVSGVSGVPKGMQVGELQNEEVLFDLDNGTVEVYNTLPKWMKDRITNGEGFDSTKFSKTLAGKGQVKEEVSAGDY
jgi:hypothetical protein